MKFTSQEHCNGERNLSLIQKEARTARGQVWRKNKGCSDEGSSSIMQSIFLKIWLKKLRKYDCPLSSFACPFQWVQLLGEPLWNSKQKSGLCQVWVFDYFRNPILQRKKWLVTLTKLTSTIWFHPENCPNTLVWTLSVNVETSMISKCLLMTTTGLQLAITFNWI